MHLSGMQHPERVDENSQVCERDYTCMYLSSSAWGLFTKYCSLAVEMTEPYVESRLCMDMRGQNIKKRHCWNIPTRAEMFLRGHRSRNLVLMTEAMSCLFLHELTSLLILMTHYCPDSTIRSWAASPHLVDDKHTFRLSLTTGHECIKNPAAGSFQDLVPILFQVQMESGRESIQHSAHSSFYCPGVCL